MYNRQQQVTYVLIFERFSRFPTLTAESHYIFNRRSRSLYAVARPSVVCRLLSVTFVSPTQAVQIFDNISTVLGTLAIR